MRSLWSIITSNYVINVGLISWFAAQVIKTLLAFALTKKLNLERMIGSGGMPSSHSALVCSIALAVAKRCGYSSVEFALALALAVIVMYDAMGVRRAAGEQAKTINKMIFSFKDFDKMLSQINDEMEEEFGHEIIEDDDSQKVFELAEQKRLKEFLGHTPLEVLGGALLGIIIASLMK